MIKTQLLVPEIYYNRSRDFQLLGRTIDFIFHYLKTTSNAVTNNILNVENFDVQMLDLAASTLGFKRRHEYNANELLAFCTSFSYIVKNKGNMNSIKTTLDILANIQNITDPIDIELDDYVLKIYVPASLRDLSLFEDVLDYILPAGISYQIVSGDKIGDTSITKVSYEGTVVDTNRNTLQDSQLWRYETQAEIASQGHIYNMTLNPEIELESGETIATYVNNNDLSGGD